MYGENPAKIFGSDDGSLRWLYLDLNSFFASVEQQLDPKLRGKPIAVIPVEAETTSAIAASYEAKAFGIKTGTRVSEARILCPKIQFVLAEHGRYVEFHHKVQEAIEQILPVEAVCSIDEFAFRLMGRERVLSEALRLAKAMKQQIYKEVGEHIHGSIGLAPSRYLAKVAADMHKPNGLTALCKNSLPNSLLSLKLRDLPGIGERTEAKLLRQGINSMTSLLALSKLDMQNAWGGIWGERLYEWLRGEEVDLPPTRRSSISHSHVLAPKLRNDESARLVALKLLHKAAQRLRKEGYWARRLSLQVRYQDDLISYDESLSIPECCDDLTLTEYFRKLWDKSPRLYIPRKIGVVLSDFVTDQEHTLPLFADPRREQFARAMDAVQEKFGKRAIHFASLSAVKGVAPPRIAFDNIPDVEAESDGYDED